MKCPYCGSENLVWKDGEVVCTSCGSVIDRIYEHNMFFEVKPAKPTPKYKIIEEEIPISENAVYYNGSTVSEDSLLALKLIESNEKFLLIYDTIASLPMFQTKTIKTKLAVGLYLYNKEMFNKYRMYLQVSEKYIKKLLNRIKKKEREKIQKLLRSRVC